ncbi:MAG: dehydrogenase, partial [Calditrichaeota bacterium]
MPKSIIVDPQRVLQSGVLKSRDIPLNCYQADINREVAQYGKSGLISVLRHMKLIRLFEISLNEIKTQSAFQEIAYNHKGPAHLSIGQESAAVGQCLTLGIDDLIFGSHRSHGEVLAKCFSAIEKLPEMRLQEIMTSYMDGSILKVVEKHNHGSIKDLCYDFIIYGAFAEIFAKKSGFNKGLGGSMHMFFAPFGSMPNNAIVGGSSDIAVGSALFKRINRKPGIVIANIGDGASGCGPTWEALMLAAMNQYRTLWPEDVGGAPPILFNFFNNFYGMGGQTDIETMGFGVLARIGAGVNEEGMHAERVVGWKPLAVADAIERKREILNQG